MTGETIDWNWVRFKGCNTAIASEHLMTYRSASACYLDFNSGQGTVSIGGFKSGCTSNLVVANGVLNAPDYTRTCLCAYQQQSSLALVHMPDVAAWSYDHYPAPDEPTPVTRAGINLGAPGNRMASDGKLWIEYPSVGGPSPDLPITVAPNEVTRVRRHMSEIKGELNWVGASAIKFTGTLTIRPFLQPLPPPKTEREKRSRGAVQGFDRHEYAPLPPPAGKVQGAFASPRAYTVRLYFAELEGRAPGERVFDVALQDKHVLSSFDIAKQAEGAGQVVSREFDGVRIRDDLDIRLTPADGSERMPLLCGVELVAEE